MYNKNLEQRGLKVQMAHIKRARKRPISIHVLPLPNDLDMNVVGAGVGPPGVKEDGVYGKLRPFWNTLKTIGLMPLHRTTAGHHGFGYATREMGYFLVIYTLACIVTVLMIIERVSTLMSSTESLDKLVFMVHMIIFTTPPVVLPIAHLWKARDVAKLFNDWMDFQKNFRRVTHRPLSLSFGRLPAILLALTIAINFLFVLIQLTIVTYLPSWEAVFFTYSKFLLNIHLVLWCLLCAVSSRSAAKLMHNLEQDFCLTKGTDSQQVADYRCLWLQLSKLTKDIGTTFSYPYAYILAMWFVSHLMLTYVILVGSFHGTSLWHLTVAMYVLETTQSAQWFCVFSHHVTEEVGDKVMEKLHAFTTIDDTTLYQLDKFERTVYMNLPVINLGGYVKINKELVISLWSITITYMVVLLQMHSGELVPQDMIASP